MATFADIEPGFQLPPLSLSLSLLLVRNWSPSPSKIQLPVAVYRIEFEAADLL